MQVEFSWLNNGDEFEALYVIETDVIPRIDETVCLNHELLDIHPGLLLFANDSSNVHISEEVAEGMIHIDSSGDAIASVTDVRHYYADDAQINKVIVVLEFKLFL